MVGGDADVSAIVARQRFAPFGRVHKRVSGKGRQIEAVVKDQRRFQARIGQQQGIVELGKVVAIDCHVGHHKLGF